MAEKTYTIGQVARLSGISVRRLRFYADEGLLPPAGRTEGGYRVFTDADLVRIDLVRALRDAGVGLDAIRVVLSQRSSMKQVLEIRLAEVEAQIVSQRRVASALRVAISSPEPSNDDLRRIWTMVNLSNVERRVVLERFFDNLSNDPAIDRKWLKWMVDMSSPELADDATADQIDAWIALQKLLADPVFIEQMRANARDSRSVSMDATVFQEMQDSILPKAKEAMAKGLEPKSDAGRAIADEFLGGWARAHSFELNDDFRARMRRKYLQHKPSMQRYWDLVTKLGGLRNLRERAKDKDELRGEWQWAREWKWVDEATRARLADA